MDKPIDTNDRNIIGMNQDLLQLIKDYTTKEHTEINASLLGKSKDNLVSMLLDLLTIYYNDLNSSTMRELVVAVLAGYQPSLEKLGYNGFRQNTLTGKVEHCEIKPRNVRSDSTAKTPRKLDGSGNFTDYTWAKFRRHQEENPNMLVAGFLDAHLIHIFEFSFNEQGFTSRLQEQLERRFPTGDITSEYLRSAQFSFTHYKDAESLKTIYIASKQELTKAQPHITKNLFNYLEKTAQ
ncbi:MAG: hypothetical protein OXU36_06460 [Candidatus Poribacteria bacterium]|nr:hypothetical protein [Candidatus Poribacteria bacterium]